MNYHGIIIGILVFLIIGIFHQIVIKGEYYFTKKIWPVFLVSGIGLVAASLFIQSYIGSTLLSIVGFCCFWGIRELYEQDIRVKKGWFPQNPKRQKQASDKENP